MKAKINIDKIQDRHIIVVHGDEKKVVYDCDDSRIFSVHITGCGRGARNAVLSRKTFMNLKQADKGIKYLDDCFWTCKFRIIKVSELEKISMVGYQYLIEDIKGYNSDIDWSRKMEIESKKEAQREYSEMSAKARNLINDNLIISIKEEDDVTIIKLSK
jgi:hypothetical protein